jgi:toxin ParE1/3/4
MYKLSAAAAQDIDALLSRSLLDFGLPQTEIYYQSLQECLRLIGENPELGIAIDDIRAGYRCFPHQSHIVYYQSQLDHVRIIRVLHQRMDAIKAMDQIDKDGE